MLRKATDQIDQFYEDYSSRLKNDKTDVDANLRLEHIQKLRNASNPDNFLEVIDEGLNQFKKFLKSDDYVNVLKKFKQLYKLNEKEKNKRLEKLFKAILNDDKKEIQLALENGGFAVVNAIYTGKQAQFRNKNPLIYIVQEGNSKVLKIVLKKLCNIKPIPVIQDIFFQTWMFSKDSPLSKYRSLIEFGVLEIKSFHKFFYEFVKQNAIDKQYEYGYYFKLAQTNPLENKKVIVEILKNTKDFVGITNFEIDKNNYRLLHLACESGLVDLLKFFIQQKENIQFEKTKSSPLYLAIKHNQPEIVKVLLDAGVQVQHGEYIFAKNANTEIQSLIVQPIQKTKKELKKKIIEQGPVVSLEPQKIYNPIEIILSGTYLDIEKGHYDRATFPHKAKKYFQESLNNHPCLASFFNVWSLGVLGMIYINEPKPLRSIISTRPYSVFLMPKGISGRYHKKQTLYVGLGEGHAVNFKDVISHMVHEAGHFIFEYFYRKKLLSEKILNELDKIRMEVESEKELLQFNLENLIPPDYYEGNALRSEEVLMRLYGLMIQHPVEIKKFLNEHSHIQDLLDELTSIFQSLEKQYSIEKFIEPFQLQKNQRQSNSILRMTM